MDPFRLCNPVDKNGEGIQDPDAHLVCYYLQPASDNLGLSIPIQNQFFTPSRTSTSSSAFAVCAPSVKTVPEPSGFVIGLVSGLMLRCWPHSTGDGGDGERVD